MFNIAICDDEDVFINKLKYYLKKYADETGREFCFFVYHNGIELLAEYKPDYDLIFKDIRMENLNGLKTAEKIRKMDSAVGLIFLTSLKQYVWKGYEYNAVNYLYAKLYNAARLSAEECKEAIYLIGSDAGIERKYISPSKAFIDSLSVDVQKVCLYGMVGAVVLIACILVIYGVFYLSVIGRIHQFGQLRTIGMTRKQIKKLVSHEGGILYLRSAPMGIANDHRHAVRLCTQQYAL